MPITITIQGANAEEVRQLALDVAETIFGMQLEDIADTKVSTIDEPDPVCQPDPQPPETDEPKKAVPAKEITDVELRAAAQAKGRTPEGKAAIKALLAKYGAPNVTGVPLDQREAFLAELEAL
jgi:hypothetical protein